MFVNLPKKENDSYSIFFWCVNELVDQLLDEHHFKGFFGMPWWSARVLNGENEKKGSNEQYQRGEAHFF
jgi:hypothetical protein